MTICEKYHHQTRANMSKITHFAFRNRISRDFLIFIWINQCAIKKKKKKSDFAGNLGALNVFLFFPTQVAY